MANIRIKRSALGGRVPTVDQLELGELAVNTYDGKIYLKKRNIFVLIKVFSIKTCFSN